MVFVGYQVALANKMESDDSELDEEDLKTAKHSLVVDSKKK